MAKSKFKPAPSEDAAGSAYEFEFAILDEANIEVATITVIGKGNEEEAILDAVAQLLGKNYIYTQKFRKVQ